MKTHALVVFHPERLYDAVSLKVSLSSDLQAAQLFCWSLSVRRTFLERLAIGLERLRDPMNAMSRRAGHRSRTPPPSKRDSSATCRRRRAKIRVLKLDTTLPASDDDS